jgi:hypothetical protein
VSAETSVKISLKQKNGLPGSDVLLCSGTVTPTKPSPIEGEGWRERGILGQLRDTVLDRAFKFCRQVAQATHRSTTCR